MTSASHEQTMNAAANIAALPPEAYRPAALPQPVRQSFSQRPPILRILHKFVKGPILEATPPFETDASIEELIQLGILSPRFRDLQTDKLPLDGPLYIHQQHAIEKTVKQTRNIVVATGTGSGKTEAFLIPILQHLFEQDEAGRLTPGVRALLLYPMNALANDQMASVTLQVAYREAIKVPQELGVVGFDGLVESAYYWPPLTTVFQDFHTLGCTAVKELVEIIEAKWIGTASQITTRLLLQPELVIRESSIKRG